MERSGRPSGGRCVPFRNGVRYTVSMLVCFYGSDTERARAEARAYIGRDGRPPEWIVASEWYPGQSTESAETMPLFGGAKLFVLDTPTQSKDFATEIFDALPAFKTSPHTFVLIEGGLLVAYSKPLQASADDVFEYKKPAAKNDFNSFALADALAAKDKRKLWTLLRTAYAAGQVPEAIAGMFMWQLKALLLAARTKSPEEADMKDFTYNKAKRALANFKSGEVENLVRSLLRTYHDGHSIKKMDDALEEWVLGL